MKTYSVEIPEFITHVAKTDNKVKANKYVKVNNQNIYNSNLNRFARNIVVRNLHNYLIEHIKLSNLPKLINPPYQVSLTIFAPINYGAVSRRSKHGTPYICWYPAGPDYQPNWDIGNIGELWLKTFEDSLQLAGVLENDNVKHIISHGPITFSEVLDLKDRKLLFKVTEF